MGRRGPCGICMRTAVVDIDGDGKMEIVIADADIVDSKVAVLRNADGKGGLGPRQTCLKALPMVRCTRSLWPTSTRNGNPDIVVNEQEESLPPGREKPRWILW